MRFTTLKNAAVLSLGVLALTVGAAQAHTNAMEPKEVEFTFEGPLGHFDQAQLQRGYKVYAEVCSSCHGMNLLHYRDLAMPGGPFFDPKNPVPPAQSPYAKAIAAGYKVADIDRDTGDAIQRPATPADAFKPPYANNEAAAAANGGAVPPDLSVMARARENGPRYIYSILTGYVDPPKGLTVPAGKYYNPYMAGDLSSYWTGPKDQVPKGGFIAMPFQLTADRVSFDDKTPSTSEQEAKDVATFLAWAADPHQTERKETGVGVLAFLLILAGVTYGAYRQVWRDVDHG
jgi:ubiquinol-cytochrome c reductase cytochrome c1 subunit